MKRHEAYAKDLERCYSQQATVFGNSRKKWWPEVDQIVAILKERLATFEGEVFHIVDLGCGTGRLAPVLTAIDPRIQYLGVDNAQGMVDVGEREYGGDQVSFVCAGMVEYMERIGQESVDALVSIAAVQHLMTVVDRQTLFLACYKALQRSGDLLVVNRSYSDRLLKNYTRPVVEGLIRSFLPGLARNDVLIPRTGDGVAGTIKRYYHFFTPSELITLTKNASFADVRCGYVLQDGSVSYVRSDRRESRNSLLTARKIW